MRSKSLDDVSTMLRRDTSVFVHGTATEPRALLENWIANPSHLRGVRCLTSFVPGVNTCNLAGLARDQHVVAFMNHSAYADAEASGQLTALRLSYSEVGRYIEKSPRLDTVFVQVAPLKNGRYSTGISAELIPTAVANTDKVCAIVNDQMPIPQNGFSLSTGRVDYSVNVSRPLIEYAAGARAPDAVSLQIADHVCSLVKDGDTLQAGLGGVPGSLFRKLSKHRGLRVYGGMVTDAFASLYESGALDMSAEHIYGMALGSHEFYQWLDGRAACRVAGVEETHSVERISSIENFVAVNSAISVGLDGAVNAERIGDKSVSGPGGLPDFAAGASLSAGGRSIIALPATNTNGTISRITTNAVDPMARTVMAEYVTHVVTEFGVADLRGTSTSERASRLIGIADPRFRNTLSCALD
jgi:acyl-CoA hydrolase